MNDVKIKVIPPGKAYGYDLDTMRPSDRAAAQNQKLWDMQADANRRSRAATPYYNDHEYKVTS